MAASFKAGKDSKPKLSNRMKGRRMRTAIPLLRLSGVPYFIRLARYNSLARAGSQAGRHRNFAFDGARLCRLRSNGILFKPASKKVIEPRRQRRIVADEAGFLLLARLRARSRQVIGRDFEP